jgi:hypothetical protein
MKLVQLAAIAALGATLTACAGSVSTPVPVQDMTSAQRASLHISDVSADAAQGIEMSDTDFEFICDKVKGYIQAQSPATMEAPPAGASAVTMKIHFTQFDRGNAFARAMLIGLGQIRIEATVDLVDASGKSIAEYNVSKDFALGGMIGATTSVNDVEDGFAKSVAAIMKG